MFDNIGGKIKALAKAVCWIGIIASIIAGIVTMSLDEDMAGIGLVIILVGCLFSWVGSFFAYGFGELIEKTSEIAENTRGANPSKGNAEDKVALLEKWKTQGLIDEDEFLEQKSKL